MYTAMIMGYGTASRFSEYLPESKEIRGHAILSENVVFVIEGTDGRPAMRPSHSPIPDLEKVIGCMVVITDSKNDPKGIGHRFYFPRQPVVPVTRVYDFATDMWTFARRSRPVKGKPFFHCALSGGVGGWSLCQTVFNERLKAMAKRLGLDESKISSHSLRAGAATALGAAHVPDYVIKNFGGWSSEAFLRYVRATTQLYSHVHDILASTATMSIDSVCMTNCFADLAGA